MVGERRRHPSLLLGGSLSPDGFELLVERSLPLVASWFLGLLCDLLGDVNSILIFYGSRSLTSKLYMVRSGGGD